MGQASYTTVIYLSGTPTIFANLPCTADANNDKIFRINDAAKRILDEKTEIEVFVTETGKAPVKQEASGYKINSLLGQVTFDSKPNGTVDMSGKYLPLSKLAGCHQYSLTYMTENLDATELGSSGYRSFEQGIANYSLNLGRFYEVSTSLFASLVARSKFVISIEIGGQERIIGRYVISSHSLSGDVSSLEDVNLDFTSSQDTATQFVWSSF